MLPLARMPMPTARAAIAGTVAPRTREATSAETPGTVRPVPIASIVWQVRHDRRRRNLKSPRSHQSRHVLAYHPRTLGPAQRPTLSKATSPPTPASGASTTCRVGSSTTRRSLSGVMQTMRRHDRMGVGGRSGETLATPGRSALSPVSSALRLTPDDRAS